MDLSWAPVYPPLLAYDEPRGYMPDRPQSRAVRPCIEYLLGRALPGAELPATHPPVSALPAP